MRADVSLIQPILVAALVVWALYRRIRRNFGRQVVAPRRMMIRVGLLALIALLLTPIAMRSPLHLAAMLGGLSAGVGLGLWGAAHTRFFDADGRRYYVPHTYSGLIVTLVFVGRLAYRLVQPHPTQAAADRGGGFAAAVVQNPSTLAAFFMLVGYYVCFYVRVLQKSKHPAAADFEPASAAVSAEEPPPP